MTSAPRIVLYTHLWMFALLGMIASAALTAGVLLYGDDPTRMVLAGVAGTMIVSIPVMIVGYPLILRYLLKRAGYETPVRRLLGMLASFFAAFAASAFIPAGTQAGIANEADVFLTVFFCGWVGATLVQVGIASVMQWPVRPSPAAPYRFDAFAKKPRRR